MPTGGVVTIDLHGKNIFQARVAVGAALRRADGGVYRIRLIHGCHFGTVLKDMIWSEYAKNVRVLRLLAVNDSVTDLVLREL